MSPTTAAGRRAPASGHRRGGKASVSRPSLAGPTSHTLRGITCRLRIELPRTSWPYLLTMAHPNEEIRIINRTVIPGGLRRYDFLINVPNPAQWIGELRQAEGTVDVSGVMLADGSAMINLVLRKLTLDPLFHRKGLLWKLPFPVHDGAANCEVIGTYPDLLRTIEDLAAHGFRIHLESVGSQTIDDLESAPLDADVVSSNEPWSPLEGLYSRVVSFVGPGASPAVAPTGAEGSFGPSESRGRTIPDESTTWGVGHLAVCRLGLSLPKRMWATVLSEQYPDTSMEIIGELVVDAQRTMVDFRIRSSMARDWVEEIRKLPGVMHVDPLGRTGSTATMRVTFPTHPLYVRFAELNLMWRMPSPVKEGVLTMVIVGQDEAIRRMIEDWRSIGLSVTLESVRHQEEEPRTLLTPRQEEIFRRAMSSGYYDVPRKATLSELAASMGMAVSSLSEILAVVEKKLLHHAEATA